MASFILTAVLVLSTALCSAQDSIQYQLVIRNAAGQLITNKQVNMKFSLVNGGQSFYEETQKTTTDKYGNISVFIGTGTAVKGAMKDVPWSTMDISLKVESDTDGGNNFKELGTVPIAAAPYAMFAATAGSNANGGSPKDGEALFEVCDRDGQPVFAVYNSGIVVYVDESAPKAKRSGLVVTGRSSKDGESADYFAVDAEGTHIYVDDADESSPKAARSGLVVTGRSASKSATTDEKHLSDDRTATKADGVNIFTVNGGLTTVYVDDADNDDKAPRSGFVVTGRTASKGKNLVDIYGDRTQLNTTTLKIGSPDDITAAMQLDDEHFEFGNDVTYGGDVRPVIEVDEDLVYTIYLSDAQPTSSTNDYTFTNFDGYYEFAIGEIVDNPDDFLTKFYHPATFIDDLCVPISTDKPIVLFNRRAEETSILKDAVVAVIFSKYSISVWPLEQLSNFNLSFAMTDFKKTSTYSGKASRYARFDVTLNSSKPFAGCQLELNAPNNNGYTAHITSKTGLYEPEISPASSYNVGVVYGETLTIAVSEAPAGQVLDSWYYSTDGEIFRRSSDSILRLPVTTRNIVVYPTFKDISPVLYVDGENGDDTNGDGTNGKQFKTIARALTAILDSSDNTRRGFLINVENYAGDEQIINIANTHDGRAKHITIDLNNFDNKIGCINVNSTVPVIVKNGTINPQGGDIVANTAAIRLSGTRLTLENIICRGSGIEMCGALVDKGELVLTKGSEIITFSSNYGGGAMVYSGGKLTLKQNSRIDSNTTAHRGGGVYLSDGAIMSIYDNSAIYGNTVASDGNGSGVYMVDGSTLIVGSGNIRANSNDKTSTVVYVEKGANLIIEDIPTLERVALANGASINVKTSNLVSETADGPMGNGIGLYKITNPEAVAVNLDNQNLPEEQKERVLRYFHVEDQNLLAQGYSTEIGLDGKPFITKKIYATGFIRIFNGIQDYITYVYYHGEGDDEYLYLHHNFYGYENEYRKYWLVGDKIYCDTAYVCDGTNVMRPLKTGYEKLPYQDDPTYTWQTDWDNFVIARNSDCYNLLQIDANALSGYTTQEKETGDILYIYNDRYNMACTRNSIVREIYSIDLFKYTLPGFKSLLKRAILFEGINHNINDLTELYWQEEGDNNMIFFGNDVNTTAVEEPNLPRLDSPDDIERMFKQLRRGFNVYIGRSPGGKVIDKGTGLEFDYTKRYPYDTTLTIEAVPTTSLGTSFLRWSDGDTTRIRQITVHGNIELYPIFKQTKFHVNAAKGSAQGNGTLEKPFADFAQVKSALTEDYQYHDITIVIDGKLEGELVIDNDFNAASITICGLNGNTADSIIGKNGENGSADSGCLSIVTSIPVTIKNLKITKGYSVNYGGGIYCGDGSRVTLDNGALVTKNTANSYGGGVYVDEGGTLVMNNGAVISNNFISSSTSGFGGNGVCVCGSESKKAHFEMNGGEIRDHQNSNEHICGALFLSDANFTMTGGKITNNYTQLVGANIFATTSSVLNISGGEISHGQSHGQSGDARGGAIYLINSSTLNLSGTTEIFGNWIKATSGYNIDNRDVYASGGAIYVGSDCALNMSGGVIYDNYAVSAPKIEQFGAEIAQGGAIYCAGTFNISGSAYISPAGARVYDNGTYSEFTTGNGLNDVYVCSGKTINVTDELETNGIIATITPETYEYTPIVLSGIDEETVDKFALTPIDNEHDYHIRTNGKVMPDWMIQTNTGSHYYVDLGSAGKWATTNVGADNAWNNGCYFGWGQTSMNITKFEATYYNNNVYYNSDNGSYPTSGTLPSEKDAAHTNWGGNWFMPQYSEAESLLNDCHWEWTSSYKGKSGYIVYKTKSTNTYSLHDPHIFLPISGYKYEYNGQQSSSNNSGRYWTASCSKDQSYLGNAYYLSIDNSSKYTNKASNTYRYYGQSVRPVWRPSK